MKNRNIARFARAIFTLVYSPVVLVPSMTSNDLFCCFVDAMSNTTFLFSSFYFPLQTGYTHQLNFRAIMRNNLE